MKKVLSVDDSKVVRTMVARHLKPYGVQVVEAENGEVGVEAAKREQPDLILLDVTMPVMDGREALAALRAEATTKAIPVVMLTAESGKDLVMELMKLGVTGYIVKPFTQETFDKAVSKVLGPPGDPAAVAAAAQAAAPAATTVDRRAVLVVDDSEKVLEVAKNTLGRVMRVLTAESGKDAVVQYAATHPGIVVIDLAMPDMDGFQTLDALKQAGGADSRYIALAVRGDAAARDRAKKAGFVAVIEKPLQEGALVEHVTAAAELSPEDAMNALVADQAGCPVIVMPDPRSKVFQRCLPLLQKKLRSLAEAGQDRVVLDLLDVTEATTTLTKVLVSMITEATGMGLRTAICSASEPVVQGLKEFAETRAAVYAETREAAVERLG